MKSEDVPQIPKRNNSNNNKNPNSGQMCNIKMRENDIMSGTILHYFDDSNGVEHVLIDLGPIMIVRPSSKIIT